MRIDHAAQRQRALAYWRGVIGHGAPFRVPEERFNTFARGLIARIRISATKDPKSGILMAPATSYNCEIYANEAVFQAQLLDVLEAWLYLRLPENNKDRLRYAQRENPDAANSRIRLPYKSPLQLVVTWDM